MKKINLCLGIHNHQPVGNFDFVFEDAYKRAYLPFQEILERHPKIKIAQHFTGILFEWIQKHEPTFIPRLKKLVGRGQVEMMTGGFYEPIMSVIPDEDKRGQIHKLTSFVRKHTGYEATGMWLAERIWEPHLPRPLAEAGIEFVVLDDSHFRSAGLSPEQLLGYFVTEEQGYAINLFPISERMRYLIPFREPEETINFLRSQADDSGTRLVVYADDGEKFGTWPNTYKHCYEDGWLDRFFSALDRNSDWINIMHFGDALKQLRPAGRVYLPTASYREMMEWAMPTAAIHRYEQFEGSLRHNQLFEPYKDFVRGGFWRNFLIKYPEINSMHKKMLLVSQRLNRLNNGRNAAKLQKAKAHLWASQCNCPYWHGVFGGAYLNHLRYAIYHEMLQAEKVADELEHSAAARKTGWVNLSELDFDLDGSAEVLVSTKSLNAYFAPNSGGTLFELDFKPKAMNLMDSMSRREEAYHQKLATIKQQQQHSGDGIASIHDLVVAKEEGLEKKLHYDWYRRSSLVDHFLEPGTTLEQFAAAKFHEKGNFVNQPYEVIMEPISRRSGKQTRKAGATGRPPRLTLWRQAHVWVGEALVPVEVKKAISFEPAKSRMQIDYSVSNLHSQAVDLWFGMEFLFALLAGNTNDRFYTFSGKKPEQPQLGSLGVVENVQQVGLTEEWLNIKIDLRIARAATVWRFPIETISQSEAGFERVYQSSIVFPNWQLHLEKNESWHNSIMLQVS